MLHEHAIHFLQGNFFSATVDNFLETAGNEEVAITIQEPLVTCPKPTICKGAGVGCRIVFIALEDGRTTRDHLTDFTRWAVWPPVGS